MSEAIIATEATMNWQFVRHATDETSFRQRLVEAFPVLSSELDPQEVQIHLDVAVFRRYAHAALIAHDDSVMRECFAFLNEVLADVHPSVENAIEVSFLEPLFLGDEVAEASWAEFLLPERAKALMTDLRSRWAGLP